jgi:hypothetical protein
VEKLSEMKAIAKSRGAGQCIDKKQYSRVISMNDAIDQNPYDTSPFRSEALRPVLRNVCQCLDGDVNLPFEQSRQRYPHSRCGKTFKKFKF